MTFTALIVISVFFLIVGYLVGWRFPLKLRKGGVPPTVEDNTSYEQHEPMYLLDFLHFGSKFRIHCAKSVETLLEDYKPSAERDESRFSRITLFREEVNSCEDLGALLLAIREKNRHETPILKTLMHYDSDKVIISKLTAQHDIPKFIDEFGLENLICKAYLPEKFKDSISDIRKKIAEIVINTFGQNSAPEKYEAFIRIKHGPIIFKYSKGYCFDKEAEKSKDYSGVLIKTRRISQKLKQTLNKHQRRIPIIAYCMPYTPEAVEKAAKNIDISTRFQQLLAICLLQRDHSEHLRGKNITQERLLSLGSDMDLLLTQLPDASTSRNR